MFKKDDVVYLSGPMTGVEMFNYPAFFALAGIIKKEYNCRVLNPARHPLGLTHDEYMRLAMIDLECATQVVMLDDWRGSKGAKIEFLHALELKIRVFRQEQIVDRIRVRMDERTKRTVTDKHGRSGRSRAQVSKDCPIDDFCDRQIDEHWAKVDAALCRIVNDIVVNINKVLEQVHRVADKKVGVKPHEQR